MPDTAVRRERARPMSPEERRDKLIDVTLDLLREHGRAVTTRQIAAAAGVAEGTIFRVVESKEELVEAAIADRRKQIEDYHTARREAAPYRGGGFESPVYRVLEPGALYLDEAAWSRATD